MYDVSDMHLSFKMQSNKFRIDDSLWLKIGIIINEL